MTDDPLQSEMEEKAPRKKKRGASSFVGNNRHLLLVQFGSAVRERRNQLGLTQEKLASLTGISRSSISEIEAGTENVSLVRASKIAVALDTTLADLLTSKAS